MNKWKYIDCRHFKLIKAIDEGELDKYYCGHVDNMESDCEYASCPLNFTPESFEERMD